MTSRQERFAQVPYWASDIAAPELQNDLRRSSASPQTNHCGYGG
jgi:hypothetical protein